MRTAPPAATTDKPQNQPMPTCARRDTAGS
jgi:hypothetical protein